MPRTLLLLALLMLPSALCVGQEDAPGKPAAAAGPAAAETPGAREGSPDKPDPSAETEPPAEPPADVAPAPPGPAPGGEALETPAEPDPRAARANGEVAGDPASRAEAEEVREAGAEPEADKSGDEAAGEPSAKPPPAAGPSRATRPPPRPIVSSEMQRRRAEAVRSSLASLARKPSEKPLTASQKLAVIASLTRQARMQLSAFRAERSRFEQERDATDERGRQLDRELKRLPALVGSGSLPVAHVEDARRRAEDTVAEVNELFDRAFQRRAELAEALERYESDLQEASRLATGFRRGDLAAAMRATMQALDDRLASAEELIRLLDEVLTGAVEVGEKGAELSLDLSRAMRVMQARGVLARTSEPVSVELAAVALSELAALRTAATDGLLVVAEATKQANPFLSGGLTLLLVALFVLLWWGAPQLPSRLVTDTAGIGAQRLARALHLLVPVGRAVLVMALWALLVNVWGLPGDLSLAGVSLGGAWAAFFLLNYILRELLGPEHPEFRIIVMRDEAARNLYSLLRALAAYTAALLPIIILLKELSSPPAEAIRFLELLLGAGLLAIGVMMTRGPGGLRAILPAADTPEKTMLQHSGQALVSIAALGIVGGLVAAAGGYSNLSAYLSRGITLEVLLVFASTFLYHLVLYTGDLSEHPAWQRSGTKVFWAIVVLLQIPIWQIKGYHIAVAYDLLATPLVTVQGAEVSATSILKGILLVLIFYFIARFVRRHVQASRYLQERFQSGIAYAFSSLAFYLIVAGGALWGILVAGLQLNALAILAGTAGIGLGFGLQDVVKNFVSGLILLIERPVAVGDFVEVGDLRGYITAINLRSTTIRSRENNLVLVPNSDLATSRVINLTLSDPRVRVDVDVGVSYDSDLRLVHDLILRAARENENVLSDPEPVVRLNDFGSSSVDFTLWAHVKHADDAILTPPELRMRIWDLFQEHDIEIPFPQSDLHIRSSDVPLPYAGEQEK